MRHYLDFEKPIAELEGQIEELRRTSDAGGIDVSDEVAKLRDKAQAMLRTTYAKLTPWQKAQVARHPDRPKCLDYIASHITDWTPLAGDRAFADDAAVVGGLGRFRGRAVAVLGTEKGNDTDSRVKHNFGMARPEGYRKARRIMELAGRFGLPILSFVDTAGAFPGIDAEARGQAEAIARSIEAGLEAPVPFVATIIGEGGSGGAIALAAADRILMLEHSIYSVISPEGCASILWRALPKRANSEVEPVEGMQARGPQNMAATAAEAMKITAEDLRRLNIVDTVVTEPMGGAQRDPAATLAAVGDKIWESLEPLLALDGATLRARRREKFLDMGRASVA
jgi:acetyl-CoA carboxylase carboxyl transferase subunit alpha